jgi:predicted permease
MRTLWAKLRHLLRGERAREDELRDEMAAHLEFEIEDRLARGMAPAAARAAAARRFGNATAIAERTRDAWTVQWIAALARDLRFALRTMARRPAFAAVAVLSLAVALGANTAVFAFVNAIVLRTLPVAGAQRLVILRQKNEQFHMENCCFGYPFFRELRRQDTGLEDVLAVTSADAQLGDRNQTERVQAELVSGNYFRMLGVRAAAGRLLDDADDATEGAGAVCVLSYRLWQERFAADPAAVGKRVMLSGTPFQIVGVTEPGFSGAALHDPRDLQVPTAMIAAFYGDKRDVLSYQLIGRLKPHVTPRQLGARLNVVGIALEKNSGRRLGPHDDFLAKDGSQGVNSGKEQFGKPVLVLGLLVAVLLVIACANVAALLLVRSVERTREAGMRLAIGASRAVLFRQFLTEAVLLAAAGGIAGWAIGLALMRVLVSLMPPDDGMTKLIRPDVTAFAFAAVAALAAGVLFGILPAWRASRADPLPAIHGTSLARPGRRSLLARGVIAAQIALSLALLFCAGLFTRTLHNLRAVDLGFHPENVITMRVGLHRTSYENQAAPFFAELLRRARELPETRAASLASLNVVTGSMMAFTLQVPGYLAPNGMSPMTYVNDVSDGYFRTMGTPLLAGRDFAPAEPESSVMVNEQFARQFFAGDALGKAVTYGRDSKQARIVGVVRTAKFQYIREEPKPVIYRPRLQQSQRAQWFLELRTTGDPARAIARLRTLLHDLAPGVPIEPPVTMEMQLDAALSRERLLAFLSTMLGAVAAALAAIGLYGVLSFAVTRRTREIGIRLSIGAQRAGIVALFLRESAWMLVAGVAAGIPLMFACGRLAGTLLYGLQARDAGVLIAAVAGFALVAAAAAAIPAARAARVDPIRALRE